MQGVVGQEAAVTVRVWALGPLTSGQPRCPGEQGKPASREPVPASWLVEFRLASAAQQYNFLFAAEMTLCKRKPQTGFQIAFLPPLKCILLNPSMLSFSPSPLLRRDLQPKT